MEFSDVADWFLETTAGQVILCVVAIFAVLTLATLKVRRGTASRLAGAVQQPATPRCHRTLLCLVHSNGPSCQACRS